MCGVVSRGDVFGENEGTVSVRALVSKGEYLMIIVALFLCFCIGSEAVVIRCQKLCRNGERWF